MAVALVITGCAPDTSEQIGGETQWIDVGGGELKTHVFEGADVADGPILVLVLHGDLPNPPPDYQYLFAKMLTLPNQAEAWASSLRPALPPDWSDERIEAATGPIRAALGPNWRHEGIVAAGILRPGYADPSGDRSSGDMGMAVGDNYTAEVVDAVATAARRLEAMYDASAVVLVGHSGGGAIAANVLGRHPDVADAALLVACGCDPEAWRARMRAQQPNSIWDEPNASLMPLSLAGGVAPGAKVRLLVGEDDDVALPQDSRRYADALAGTGNRRSYYGRAGPWPQHPHDAGCFPRIGDLDRRGRAIDPGAILGTSVTSRIRNRSGGEFVKRSYFLVDRGRGCVARAGRRFLAAGVVRPRRPATRRQPLRRSPNQRRHGGSAARQRRRLRREHGAYRHRQGLINTPLKIDHHRSLLDEATCQTFTELIVTDAAKPYVLGTRMRVNHDKIAEIEILWTTTGYWLFNADNYLKYSSAEDWGPIPPERARLARDARRRGQRVSRRVPRREDRPGAVGLPVRARRRRHVHRQGLADR